MRQMTLMCSDKESSGYGLFNGEVKLRKREGEG